MAGVLADAGPTLDAVDSRLVADPFHLLDCAMTSEGGCALLLTTAERAADLRHPPVAVLGGGADHFGPSYRFPPAWDLAGFRRHENSQESTGVSARRKQTAGHRLFVAAQSKK
ncbi:hypothetical protein MXD60_24625 [Frankia sp. AgB32]|nr:hypothetical protein [Frankia sp. AgB32]MCK9897738.1 hypothetical protein [Frankia sp. AgB32]